MAGIRIHWIALFTGLGPIIFIHTTFLLSAYQEHVSWCFPYLDSCTSISATGRHGVAFFIFKGTMIPAAVSLMMFWYLTHHWLRLQNVQGRLPGVLMAVGVIGAMFLIVYTVALGAAGDGLRLQRRIGIIIYFSFTFLAQLLLTYGLGKLPDRPALWRLMQVLNYVVLGIGLLTLVLDIALDNYEDYEDAFEWVVALLIQCYFLVVWVLWRNEGLNVVLSAQKKGL